MSKMMLIGAIALVLAFGACEDDPLDAPPVAEAPECGSLSQEALRVLGSRVTGGNILNLNSIEGAGNTWYVAGEMEGEGYEGDDDVALWATTTDPESDDTGLEFTAVNDLASEVATWPDDDELSEEGDEIDVLFECVADRRPAIPASPESTASPATTESPKNS